MEGIGKWLYELSWPIVSRVLSALGIGTVTYTGVETALSGFLDAGKGIPLHTSQPSLNCRA